MLLYKSGLKAAGAHALGVRTPQFKFSDYTTYGLGGYAAEAYFPGTITDVKNVYDRLKAEGKEFTVLGYGSNVLASDKGYDGAVICTRKLSGIYKASGGRLFCLSGTPVAAILKYCREKGLGGLEYLYGIPASIGGAAYMNAGVGSGCVASNIVGVKLYNGKNVYLSNSECNFGYRRSTMRDINGVITAVLLQTYPQPRKVTDEIISNYRARRAHLPKGRSCGCVFKNPEGVSAGLLIETAHLKAARVGGARVSEKHASFIINEGGNANDVRTLIEIVKAAVYKKFGVTLEEEVVYIGEFNDFNG